MKRIIQILALAAILAPIAFTQDVKRGTGSGPLPFDELTAPGAAPSGKVYFYAKADGRFYGKDDAGTEFSLSGGSVPAEIGIAISDETTNLSTGTAKVTFRMPYAMTLTGVRANVNTAPTGSTVIVDINEAGSTIHSTKLSIDASEKTSQTAASAAVISDSSLANDAEITIDLDQVGSTIPGKGGKIWLIGVRQ
jgi:hypothetical protein